MARQFLQQDASIVFAMDLAEDARPFLGQQPLCAAKDFHLRAFHVTLQKVGSGAVRVKSSREVAST